MTLPVSGPISLNNVNVELGLSGTTSINMNQASVRTLFAVPSGAISMSNGYGKSNRVAATATISTDTSNYTVNTAKAPGYAAGTTDFTLTINNGVFVSSSSTGSYAMTVDTSWAPGDTVSIVNNGTIVGRGGNGGAGGTDTSPPISGNPGSSAGPALLVQRAINLTNGSGRIAGGGGGGGGGALGDYPPTCSFGGGGGGGGGIGVSSGGNRGNWNGQNFGQPGSAGTLSAAGPGGSGYPLSGPGGSGGGYGSSGSNGSGTPASGGGRGSGGAAGACIVGNSNITYVGPTGNRNGSIS